VYVIQSKKAPKTGKAAVIDTMGGSGLYGRAWFTEVDQCNHTHFVGDDVVIFTPEYRRPPDKK
jgi:hypothetical protein